MTTVTNWLDAAQRHADRATRGPWHWAGNTDTGEPYLATWIPGAGRCQVLAIGHAERSTTGRAADAVRSYAVDSDIDPENAVEQWATDQYGQPVRDPRLWLYTDLMAVNARDLAVYEVAPEATTREDPRVYRADVVGIRHPDAEFIAAARAEHPAMVTALVAVSRLHNPVATYLDADECEHDEPGDGFESPEWEAWHARHPEGVSGDPICLDSPSTDPICSECYTEDNGHEYGGPAPWPCTTLRMIANALGVPAPTFAPVSAPREPLPAPQTEQLDLGGA